MKRFISYFILLAVIFFFAFPIKVSAQETITTFHVDMTAMKSGDLLVQEKINYNFGNEYRHGIYRTIPLISPVGDLYRVIDIKFTSISRDGKKENYTTDNTGKKITVKIGDSDKTITGPHTYEIDYIVQNGVGSNYADHDEIYWNVTGNEWIVPIETASYSLMTDFGIPIQKAVCYTGDSGSTEENCKVLLTTDKVDVTTNSFLQSREGLTVVVGFPVGTFPKSVLQRSEPADPDLKAFLIICTAIFVLLNFILAPILLYWYLKNWAKKGFGSPSVNFDLPKSQDGVRISPAEAGIISTTRFEKEAIIATIYDLAIRKYIKIEGTITKTTWGLRENQEFTLTRLNENSMLTNFETKLLNTFFNGQKTVNMKSVKLSYTAFSDLEKKSFTNLIKRKLFIKNPKTQQTVAQIFGMITLFSGSLILGPVLLYLSRKLNGRTEEGDEEAWKLNGLKIFLKATKRYDVWQTKNFIFLEEMIPYAIALGVIDDYMKEIKVLNPEYTPSWYSGNGNLYTMYPLFNATASNNVTTRAPSSSSGFSGGSSGGGGGGGGGGSW